MVEVCVCACVCVKECEWEVCMCVHAYACAARNCGYTRVCRVLGVMRWVGSVRVRVCLEGFERGLPYSIHIYGYMSCAREFNSEGSWQRRSYSIWLDLLLVRTVFIVYYTYMVRSPTL